MRLSLLLFFLSTFFVSSFSHVKIWSKFNLLQQIFTTSSTISTPLSTNLHTFQIHRVYHTSRHNFHVLYKDVHSSNLLTSHSSTFTIRSRPYSPHFPLTQPPKFSPWSVTHLTIPDVTDKPTVVNLAKSAADAYYDGPNSGPWRSIGDKFNYTDDVGRESDGLRGHVFVDHLNSTIIIGLKGTSPSLFAAKSYDSKLNDKINDNLLFACCCGQGGHYLWKRVCACQNTHDVHPRACDSTCVRRSLREKDHYYSAAKRIYAAVRHDYPTARIWLTGHSLGGVVSSLLGLTYNLSVVTFESPGDALPASRLGLTSPPRYIPGIPTHQQTIISSPSAPLPPPIYHFGHTADSVFMGTCNSLSSLCTIAGYAMQSKCHTGYRCTYDTLKDLGWREGIHNHGIETVIEGVIKAYPKPAPCVHVRECFDCSTWHFYENASLHNPFQ